MKSKGTDQSVRKHSWYALFAYVLSHHRMSKVFSNDMVHLSRAQCFPMLLGFFISTLNTVL